MLVTYKHAWQVYNACNKMYITIKKQLKKLKCN